MRTTPYTMRRIASVLLLLSLALPIARSFAADDLPQARQVEEALNSHLLVLNAASLLKQELANQRKWNSGSHEFLLNMGTGQRTVGIPRENLREWYVDVQRPVRIFDKAEIDQEIGRISVAKANLALDDAQHEAARVLLRLWFVVQREQATAQLWQQQVDILNQQTRMTEKRVQQGDAPKLELNQMNAAVAQAHVSWQQALMRVQLAESDVRRQFAGITFLDTVQPTPPQPITQDFAFWKDKIFNHNNELAIVRAETQLQQRLAQRSRADVVPDPTVGVRVASDMGGNEKVLSLYVSVPLSFGLRSATADAMAQQAVMAANQEAYVQRRLEADVYAAHTQAVRTFSTWQQAQSAATAIRNNAALVTKAYQVGESSLSDSLTARRIALESTLIEYTTQLDANEARYRLLIDIHQLWLKEE
ncbi:MAG: TolC family protein [Gallionella sp.]